MPIVSCIEQREFQFHKGTIKTRGVLVVAGGWCHFNSIKVRLKPWCPRGGWWLVSFQFHKGTIKTKTSFDRFNGGFLFQFHKGTIKTFCAKVQLSR